MHNTDFNELAQLTGAAIFDPETSELLLTGALDLPDIAKWERAVHSARAAFDSLRRPGACAVEALRNYYEKFRKLETLREEKRSAFVEKLGWRPGEAFSLAQLRKAKTRGRVKENPCDPFVGLADYFYDESGKPVGVIGHSRRTWRECHEWGTSQGLQADAIPSSWYGPGTLIAVLYTRQGYIPPKRVAP